MRKQTRRLTADEQTLVNMRNSLRTAKAKCASQERQIKRLTADNPLVEMEREISRLEERCEDLTQLLENAEMEVRQLRTIRSVA